MERTDFRRTKHPIYSWSVWGKDKEYLCNLDNIKSFGENTPWEYLCKKNAKLLILGNIQVTGLTIIHHFEQVAKVPYRAEKVFESEYIDEKGDHSIRRYSMCVKPLNVEISERKDLMDTYWLDFFRGNGIYYDVKYDGFLRGGYYLMKGVEEHIMNELINNSARRLWLFNGEEGYNNPKLNWNMARYYSIK